VSIISNTLPIKGTTATATDLNALFTDVQTATTGIMSGQNLAGQSIDTEQFLLAGSSGMAGVILVDYRSATIGDAATVTVPIETALSPTWPVVTGVLSYGASGLSMSANQVYRVYFNLNVDNKNYSTPFGATVANYKSNFYCWVVWLEYASSWNGGTSLPDTWNPVPGQSAWNDTLTVSATTYLVNSMDQIKGTCIIPHAQYFDNGGTITRSGQYLDNFAGQYYLEVPGSEVWYGLRLRIAGVFQSLGIGSSNFLGYEVNNGFNNFNSVVYGTGNITALLQRSI